MKTLYLECNMGAAGDMLSAALLELHPEPEAVLEKLNGLGLPGVRFQAKNVTKCGILGTQMNVTVDGAEEESEDVPDALAAQDGHHMEGHPAKSHTHHGMKEIMQMIASLDIPQPVREDICAVYQLIAQAESQVHGVPVEQIHFHEVGTLDAVADVTAVCLLLQELAPERIVASPVHVGCGQVRCAHGILPVPAPATAQLLKQIPTYGGQVRGELCTPTGAALLRHFVEEFSGQPIMRVEQIGYGFGKKDFAQANCVRAMLGEA